jgi:signal transduction histidine kinase
MKRRRFLIRSVYVKFIFFFVGIVWVSSGIAFATIAPTTMDAIRNNYAVQIGKKAAEIREFCADNKVSADRLTSLFTEDTYEVKVFTDFSQIQQSATYGKVITAADYRALMAGKTVRGNFTKDIRLPYAGIKAGGDIVMIQPRVKNNLIPYFKNIIIEALLICAGLGSVLIAVASMIIIRPIRKLTDATKEVAKGNFDVRVKVKSGDEIGNLTENFNKMTADLKNIEYLRKDFISNVSHEFKTPITSIQGFAKLIRDKNLPEEQFDEYTGIIISESGRLANLSSSLLRLSKLENQEIHEKFTKYSLDEQIRKAILLLENKWSRKNIELDLALDETSYYGDEELMQQVWINLISNAVKFSNENGLISVSLRRANNKLTVQVADNGIGIPDEAKGRIFDKFFKADKARSEDGNGLGLAIVKKIVELHHGKISFESEVNKGSVFTVELFENHKNG